MPGHVELPGSHRHQRGRKPVDALARHVPLTIGLHLKTPNEHAGSPEDFATLKKGTTRRQLDRKRCAQYAQAVREVRKFAVRHGIDVVDVDFGRRRVRLRGTAGQFTAAFDVNLSNYRAEHGHYHSHQGPLGIPENLAPWIRGVLGFDSRPRLHRPLHSYAVTGAAVDEGLWPADIARLYGIDAPGRGRGQCIAVIAPRGGYLPDDLKLAAQHIGAAFPRVAEVSVDNGGNAFGGGTAADLEVALDLQVAGAIAPAARLVIYFTDDSEQGLADAVLEAVHDTSQQPDVVAIS
jgi:kumamolisin